MSARANRACSSCAVTNRGTSRAPAGAAARRPERSIIGRPTIQSWASSMPRQASQQHLGALVGADQAEAEHHGRAVVRQLGGQSCREASALGQPRLLNRAVADHMDAPGSRPCGRSPARGRTRCGRRPRRPARTRAAGSGAGEPRSSGSWIVSTVGPARQQPQVQARHREPLEVRRRRPWRAAVAQHVGEVLGALADRAQPRARGAVGVAVEELVAPVYRRGTGGSP